MHDLILFIRLLVENVGIKRWMNGGEDAGFLAPSPISHYNFCHSPNEIFLSRIFSTCLSNILSCGMENSELFGMINVCSA